jgi:hypothetical protein
VLGGGTYLLLSQAVFRSSHTTVDSLLGYRYAIGAGLVLVALLLVLEEMRRAEHALDAVMSGPAMRAREVQAS